MVMDILTFCFTHQVYLEMTVYGKYGYIKTTRFAIRHSKFPITYEISAILAIMDIVSRI